MTRGNGQLMPGAWTRREMMCRSAGVLTIALTGVGECAQAEWVSVIDTRIAPSERSVNAKTASVIDVAQGEYALWDRLRRPLDCRTVRGQTRWADFLVVRGQLEAHGLRVRRQVLESGLVDWEMS
jgi:hypothetical protein